jgi:cytochrome P450
MFGRGRVVCIGNALGAEQMMLLLEIILEVLELEIIPM